jgi:hypothetical protein
MSGNPGGRARERRFRSKKSEAGEVTMAPEYFETEETRDPAEREAELIRRLPGFIDDARREAPGWARDLHECGDARIDSRKALAALPLLRKSDLPALQAANPPFGGFVTGKPIARIMVSPGPIHEPQSAGADPFRRGLPAEAVRDFVPGALFDGDLLA